MIRRVYDDPADLEARESMLYVSLLGGLALANTKLGAVHGFAGALGGITGASHGAICGTLLPYVTESNIRALTNAKQEASLDRYTDIARWVTDKPDASHDALIQWLYDVVADLSIPSLGTLGLKETDIDAVVAQSQKSSSMKGNPITLSQDMLTSILQTAL